MTSRTDELLMHIAREAGDIQSLYKTFFGFLYRHTDVYVVDPIPTRKMGFDVGQAEKQIVQAFRSFPLRTPDGQQREHMPQQGEHKSQQELREKSISVAETTPNLKVNKQLPSLKPDLPASSGNTFTPSSAASLDCSSEGKNETSTDLDQKKIRNMTKVHYTDDGKQIPIGNGGIGAHYSWTQTLEEVTLYVPLPTRKITSKDVICEIYPTKIQIGVKNEDSIVMGQLGGGVKQHECFWVKDNDDIVVHLEKQQPIWWRSFIVGDPEIDTTKVDSRRDISEYDQATQAAIRNIIHEQSLKATQQSSHSDVPVARS